MLEVLAVCKTYHAGTPNEVPALRNLSLQVPEAGFVVIIGTNGSGKSTLMNLLAGSERPDTGQVVLAGRDVTSWAEHRRARLIGRVFQNPFSGTAPGMSIAENLALAARRGHWPDLGWALGRRRREAFRDRLRQLRLGLEDRLDNLVGSLSGGQRQALTLLMATWQRPQLLLLDEHTAALDPKSAEQVIRLTSELVRRERLTTLMITHSMAQAAHLGDRLVMMHRGQICLDAAGAAKQRLHVEDLLARFEAMRRRDQLDPSAADLLRRAYV